MKFTDAFIRNLKPESTKYYKREANGFTVKVWPSGSKTWLYIYTLDGRRKETRLGEYPAMKLADARLKYNEAYELHKNGSDPGAVERQLQEERRLAPTVVDLCEEYMEKWAIPRKKSWKNDRDAINLDILPAWRKLKAKDIRKRDIILLLEGVIKRGAPVASNRLRALLTRCSPLPLRGTLSR